MREVSAGAVRTSAMRGRRRRRRAPDAKAELLRSLPGFASLPDRARSRLARAFDERTVPPGTVLTRAGEPCHELVLVVEGQAVDTVAADDVVELGPGAFLGDAWLQQRDQPWTLVARTPMRLLVAGPDRAAELRRDADVLRPLAIDLAARLHRRPRPVTAPVVAPEPLRPAATGGA